MMVQRRGSASQIQTKTLPTNVQFRGDLGGVHLAQFLGAATLGCSRPTPCPTACRAPEALDMDRSRRGRGDTVRLLGTCSRSAEPVPPLDPEAAAMSALVSSLL